MAAGFAWEEAIGGILGPERVIRPGRDSGGEAAFFSHAETVALLRETRDDKYIFQASLTPPASFYRQLDPRKIW